MKKNRLQHLCWCLIIIFLSGPIYSQTQLKKSVIANGAVDISGNGIKVNGTFGQPITGNTSQNINAAIGFWNRSIGAITASITGENLDCNNTAATLTVNASVENATYLWSGPSGFSASTQSIEVTLPGVYGVIVTSEAGAEVSAFYSVTQDIEQPNVSATGSVLACGSGGAQLQGNSSTPGVSFSWGGPDGFSSFEQNPIVGTVGEYILTVTSPNGCSSSINVEVTGDTNVPTISVSSENITCNNPTATLVGSSSTPNVTYSWTGPSNFSSNAQNIGVSVPGVYILTVTNSNGCAVSQSVTVLDDTSGPAISLSFGNINCENKGIVINYTSSKPVADIFWINPDGTNGQGEEILASLPGLYIIEFISEDGCSTISTITLTLNLLYEATITTTPATAEAGGVAQIFIVGGTGPFSVLWSNGATGASASNLDAGMYTVEVTDGFGCVSSFDFVITSTVSVDDLLLESDIKVYPNPFTSQLNLEILSNKGEDYSFDIFNIQGQRLSPDNYKTGISGIYQFDLENFPSGLYYISVRSDLGIQTIKVVKE